MHVFLPNLNFNYFTKFKYLNYIYGKSILSSFLTIQGNQDDKDTLGLMISRVSLCTKG